ncbi:MAG: hypothetical protein CM15mV122_200 [uncultured marine virus]|nr:MAG: hypothetical protein CM15mV122_200 [uncultured marine virus]
MSTSGINVVYSIFLKKTQQITLIKVLQVAQMMLEDFDLSTKQNGQVVEIKQVL